MVHTIETTRDTLALPDDATIRVTDLPAGSVAYLLQYGLSKSLQDAASGLLGRMTDLKAKVDNGTATEADTKAYDKARDGAKLSRTWADGAAPEAFGTAVADGAKAERLAKIMAGEMDIPAGTPRLSGLAKIMRDYAIEVLRNAYAAKKAAWPKESEVVNELVGKYLAKNGAKAQAEAERRMATTAAEADDLDGII